MLLYKEYPLIKRRAIVLFCCLLLLTGCASPSTQAPQLTSAPEPIPTTLTSTNEAQKVLIEFFDLLHSKQYSEAGILYGGDYEQLQVFNADADPADHAALWSWSCEMSGLQCLKVRNATFKEEQGDTFIFQVEFNDSDGNLFVLGPCCGADETEMPPVSQFEYKVMKSSDGKFLVMDLPPYVP